VKMTTREIHQCECEICQRSEFHPNKEDIDLSPV
jgi:hypothetical protein